MNEDKEITFLDGTHGSKVVYENYSSGRFYVWRQIQKKLCKVIVEQKPDGSWIETQQKEQD